MASRSAAGGQDRWRVSSAPSISTRRANRDRAPRSGRENAGKRMQPDGMRRHYRSMTTLLYWIVYHLDLGRFGSRALDLAVHTWLRSAKDDEPAPMVRRRSFGELTVLHLEARI